MTDNTLEIQKFSIEAAATERSFRPIPFSHLSGFTNTWQTVTSGADKLADVYLRRPADLAACAEAARETLKQPRPWRALADILAQSSRYYGVPDGALAKLEALATGEAVMVVTGQQVGYLGGPLFTFLKAYHATRIAAELEHELGRPVLPLFWLEGRDHDLEEVRDAQFIASNGTLGTLRFNPEQEMAGYEVGRYTVSAEGHLHELAAALETPHEGGMQLLASAYVRSTLTDGMGRLLGSLLGPRGLVIVEGMDPRLKALAAPLWERIVDGGSCLTDMLYARAGELEAGGWNAPLRPTHDNYLFYLTREHRRASLTYAGQLKHPDGYVEQLSREDLREIIRRDPDAISPKAALRPAYQDYILPTVAYVAGPGEMDYHAQLTPFYREFEVSPPSLFPRLSVTVTDHKLNRHMERLEHTVLEFLSMPCRDMMKKVLREEDHGRTAKLFEESKEAIQTVFDRLRDSIADIDPTLAGAAQTTAGRSMHPLEQLREKTERAMKQKFGTTLVRLEKVFNAVHPQDKLAERVLSTGYYLAKYGPEKLLAALDELPAAPMEHYVVTVE